MYRKRTNSKNLEKLETGKLLNATIHIQRDWNSIFFNSNITVSRSSKLLEFPSLKLHHFKHKGANLYISKAVRCPNCPLQLSDNSPTLRDIRTSLGNSGWWVGLGYDRISNPINNRVGTGQPIGLACQLDCNYFLKK